MLDNEDDRRFDKLFDDYKAKMEYQNLDFDTDIPLQINEVRMEMTRKYENGEFGPVTVTLPKKPLTQLSIDEKVLTSKARELKTARFNKATSACRRR